MVFSSLIFLYIFLPVCVLLYFAFPQMKAKNAILIIASIVFYAWGEPVYVLLLIAASFVNYIFGILLGKCESKRGRAWMLVACIALDLSALVYFKYAGFLIGIVNDIFSLSIAIPKVAMPIGISFYTFQALSYTIDVYRNKVKVQRSFWRFLLYVSLFPQLIAGPIVRYSEIEEQIETRTSTVEGIFHGVFRFCIGLGKKVLLANYAASVVDAIFASAFAPTVVGSWFGMLMFSMQIYFDFSGYSDMAIGLGKVFGFTYNENFNLPYTCHSITDFWRKWHISLGTFFRDYVYIPMGGNRKHQILNLFVVWALTGLWHGASWNFVLWGLYFFVLLVIEKLSKPVLDKIPKFIRIPVTLFFVLMGWTLFKFENFSSLINVLKTMFGGAALYNIMDRTTMMNSLLLLVACVIGCTPLPRMAGHALKDLCHREEGRNAVTMQYLLTVLMFFFDIAVILLATVSLAAGSYNPFMYFRF